MSMELLAKLTLVPILPVMLVLAENAIRSGQVVVYVGNMVTLSARSSRLAGLIVLLEAFAGISWILDHQISTMVLVVATVPLMLYIFFIETVNADG